MSELNAHHVSTNISSAQPKVTSLLSNYHRPVIKTSSRTANNEFTNYTALDTFRRETVRKEEEAERLWKTKFDPWLMNEYQEMYESIGKNRGIPPDNRVIPLKRSEWQQPADALPPLYKRLNGQRRRRLLGSFPETENDKIGWRLLPEHAINMYGSNTANIPPLPKQYKISSYPG
ncbi:unnamed protein product [Adineta steineri]|uniref:Uncharacterized protein n=1 Tax=Adineta steineri TaxID=433720 RepID=A0A818GBT7_9BILA|nr:unnamed protein product [Adineta steineri]CAF0888550.1 unnamed protein product [Adineta steineri]CAF3488484.1 unnamed protein product [Adineta steineri]CAF3489201.1 unnamed protein product [Adineta steineri]